MIWTRLATPPTFDVAPGDDRDGSEGDDSAHIRDGGDEKSYCTLYGTGELEAYRHNMLRREVQQAKLRVWYPGRWHRPRPRARFRTRIDGKCMQELYEEANAKEVVLLKFRSNARIVSAELQSDQPVERMQRNLRWQSFLLGNLRCTERVYQHVIWLSCEGGNPKVDIGLKLLIELDTCPPPRTPDDGDASKSGADRENDASENGESDLVAAPDPPPCITVHSSTSACKTDNQRLRRNRLEWEWRNDDLDEWLPVYTYWTSQVQGHSSWQFPHQMDLCQVSIVHPVTELLHAINSDANVGNAKNSDVQHAIIYDFGTELLGNVLISIPASAPQLVSPPAVELRVGESLEEAMNDNEEHFEQCMDLSCACGTVSSNNCEDELYDQTSTHPKQSSDGAKHTWVSCHLLAFRYVRIICPSDLRSDVSVSCQVHSPLLEQRGMFSCEMEGMNSDEFTMHQAKDCELDQKILQCAEYTLQLCIHNSFIVDGIKRDRLPWVGDLAVSLMANAYSFCNNECIRWTLSVLGRCGLDRLDPRNENRAKASVAAEKESAGESSHINGCVDYTLWFIISHWLYQRYFGDVIFLQQEWTIIELRLRYLLTHCCDQEKGWFIINDDDWIFIDWNVHGEKDTALQVLWWHALDCGISLAQNMVDVAKDDLHKRNIDGVVDLLKDMQLKLEDSFLQRDDIQLGFTRHAHILGVLSGLYTRLGDRASEGDWFNPDATDERCQTLRRCRNLHDLSREALMNDHMSPVSTPYMKHLEVLAISRLGERLSAVETLRSYWGGMLDKGATTFFEAFNESESLAEVPQFYDRPFGRSLCHAWASGPCSLYPEILLGLRPLSDGWEQWICDPLEYVPSIAAKVETKFGTIVLQSDPNHLEVQVPAGTTMILMEKSYSSGRHCIPRETLISSHAVKVWSEKYRGWHHHATHVIEPNPAIPGHEGIEMTDVPTVYQIPGDDLYYMSFIGFDDIGYQSFVAESSDLLEWTNIRLAMGYGPEGSFDHGGVVLGAYLLDSYEIDAPRMLKQKGGMYYSLYGAYAKKGTYEPDPGYQGLASSEDGLVWKRDKDESILSIYGPGKVGDWESASIYQPWLVEGDGTYCNFYNAKQMPQWVEQIGLATSKDLHNWSRHESNPVLSVNRNDGFDTQFASDAKVFYDPSEKHWVMFYFGVGKGGAHIMVAFSKDMVRWVRDPVPLYSAGANPSGLDKQYAHKISLVRHNETWHMFYCAVGDAGRGIGLITSRPLSEIRLMADDK